MTLSERMHGSGTGKKQTTIQIYKMSMLFEIDLPMGNPLIHDLSLYFMSRFIALPQEIQESILTALSNYHGRQGLLSCSLVCRGWISTCRYLIFRHISFPNVKRVATFIELIQSPHETISRYISGLSLDADGRVQTRELIQTLTEANAVLRHLDITVYEKPGVVFAGADSLIKDLSILRIEWNRLNPEINQDVLQFIARFSNLRELVLSPPGQSMHIATSTLPPLQSAAAIKSLSLEPVQPDLVDWFREADMSLDILGITLRRRASSEYIDAVNAILDDHRAHLQSLHLRLNKATGVQLHGFTSLHTVTFTFQSSDCTSICDLLNELEAPNLKTICTYFVTLVAAGIEVEIPGTELAAILNSPKFNHLLTFCIHHPERAAAKKFLEGLATVRRQEILCIVMPGAVIS